MSDQSKVEWSDPTWDPNMTTTGHPVQGTTTAAAASVGVALRAVGTVLVSREIGTRRPTIPEAPDGVIHSVDARQHTLELLARLAPRFVSWFAPNVPTALCGGTLITDHADPEDVTSTFPPCPRCAAVGVLSLQGTRRLDLALDKLIHKAKEERP